MKIDLKEASQLRSKDYSAIITDQGKPITADQIIFFDVETAPKYETPDQYKINDPVGHNLLYEKYLQVKNSSTDERMKNYSFEDFYNTSGLYAEYNRIVCISVGIEKSLNEFSVVSYAGEDEQLILLNFVNLVNKLIKSGKKYLCGHNIEAFDIPLIVRKCFIYNIFPPKAMYTYNSKPWESQVIDTITTWRKYSSPADAKLDAIAYSLNIPSPKAIIDGSKVGEYFYKGMLDDIIVPYCEQDVKTVYAVFNKINSLNVIL